MFCFEIFSSSFYYIFFAVCTLCSLPMLGEIDLNRVVPAEQNIILHTASISRNETNLAYFYHQKKSLEKPVEKGYIFPEKLKKIFSCYFSLLPDKIFSFNLFSRPPPIG